MINYWEARLSDDYKTVRPAGITDEAEAEKLVGHPVNDAMDWAIWDSKEDDKLVRQGR